MTQEIEVYDKVNDLSGIQALGDAIAKSGMFGCDNPSQGVVLALQCMAERKPPMELAKTYHIIQGKLSKRADAMLADFRRAGGKWIWGDLKNKLSQTATVEFEGVTRELSYSIEDAKEAGVHSAKAGSNWLRFPGPMCRARLVSETLRAIAPEIVQGAYTPEELMATDPEPPQIKQAEKTETQAAIKPAGTPTMDPETGKLTRGEAMTLATDDAGDDFAGESVRDRLRKHINPHEAKINAFLAKGGRIKDGQTWEQLDDAYLERAEKNLPKFLEACGVEVISTEGMQ